MQQREVLVGVVEEVKFQNPDSGFGVIIIATENELHTVVGNLSLVCEGERIEVVGEFVVHPSFGVQFRCESYKTTMPKNANDIYAYLASGVVKGIGPATAMRIVEKYGDKSLEVAVNEPLKLSKIKGITKEKAYFISDRLRECHTLQHLSANLSDLGIDIEVAKKAYAAFGDEALAIIERNPYILCTGYFGVDFYVADEMSRNLEIDLRDETRCKAGLAYILERNCDAGHSCLPSEKLLDMAEGMLQVSKGYLYEILTSSIENEELRVFLGDRDRYIFLPHLYSAQETIATRLAILKTYFPNPMINEKKRIEKLQKRLSISYHQKQSEAIIMSLWAGIMILTGGPGTGKTTTVNGIISILEEEGYKVSLTAPTGRAAKRMTELTGREAKTIHRLLEVDFANGKSCKFLKNEKNPIKADVVIVDEISMVDTELFEALLVAMPLSCRLILVGDSDQLPSVGTGNILQDLILCDSFPYVELTEIFRQSADSLIVTNAHAIINEEEPKLDRTDSDFFFLQGGADPEKLICDLARERLPKSYKLDPFYDIQVLSPIKKGVLGVENLNRVLQQALNPKDPDKNECTVNGVTYREGDKVMQVKNDYELEYSKGTEEGKGVFNGDIGVIKLIRNETKTAIVDFDGRIYIYPWNNLSLLELGYAITVHKSQGSEFSAVLLISPGGNSRMQYKNLYYTAITRARRLLVCVGSRENFLKAVKNERVTLRYTMLRAMVAKELSNE